MWSRVVEVMFGIWLLLSPWIFRHSPADAGWWINDMATGAAVIVFGLFSFWKPTRRAHVLTLLLGGWLIGFAYHQGFGNSSPAAQNDLMLGLLLLMFAVIPNRCDRAPRSWDERRLAC